MHANTFARTRNFNPAYAVRAVAGLGLVLILTFAGAARADDVTFGFAAGMGGTGYDLGYGIAVDASGNAYTTGSFEGTVDFNPGASSYNLTSAGSFDIFVSKLDSDGNFVWAKRMGGTGPDFGVCMVLDSSGNVYSAGSFDGTVDFDPGAGTHNLTGAGSGDIFVSKLNSSGNFVWAKAMGGTSLDIGEGIAVDTSGNVYTTGLFGDTVDFDPGAGSYNLTSAGFGDIFVSKLNSSGNFVWAKRVGGTGDDESSDMALDASGNVYTTGGFQDTVDFDPGAGTANLTSTGFTDIFVSKLDSGGNFVWAKAIGASGYDGGLAASPSGDVYTTGYFWGTVDFNPGAGTHNLTSAGSADIFVSKLDSDGNFVWAKRVGGTAEDYSNGMALDASGNVYTTGQFRRTVDFDPGAGGYNLTSAGGYDIFVSKLDTSGNFVWAKAMGGTGIYEEGFGVAVGPSGVYTTGEFEGTADFNPGAGTHNLTSAGNRDIFVSKLDCFECLVVSDTTWVDFAFVGGENGSYDNPFDTLGKGLAYTAPSGTVKIKGDTGDSVSDEVMTINQDVTIEAVNGAVRIGDPGGRSSGNGRQSGFVSRD